MNFYVLWKITSWLVNIFYVVALVVLINLASKAIEVLNAYINDKKDNIP